MGRSVMTVSDAIQIVYLELDEEYDDWDWFIEDVRTVISQKYKSFQVVDSWDGREEHRILENDLAKVVVCEYCGMVSINLVPCEFSLFLLPLAEHWCSQIADGFAKLFPERLCKLGTMSNGVSVYERAKR
jgi:hypothetical protein